MNAHDPIMAADKLEEMEARMSLRMARTKGELVARWNSDCEHFAGEARVKLQAIYTQKLRQFGALAG